MIRPYLYAGALAGLILAFGGAYWLGHRAATDRAATKSLQSTLESAEKFNEGAANPDGIYWFDRLFGPAD